MTAEVKPLVYSIAGYSKTGKTTVLVELISALTDKGYKVATIKDCDKAISLDTDGKDTWRHKEAGAVLAVLNTSLESTILFKNPQELERIIELVNSAVKPDIILVEGHKISKLPKIWIPGEEGEDKSKFENIIMEYDGEINKLVSFVFEELELNRIIYQLGGSDCGKCGFEDCRSMARAVMEDEKVIEDCKELAEGVDIELYSGGEEIKLNKFAANILAGGISGMIKELKDIKDPNDIKINLGKNDE